MVEGIKSSGIRIVLIRHGETEWNRIHRFQGRSDVPLDPSGIEQAHALALALKDETPNAIYSSPLTRAMETAERIRVFHPETPLFEEEGFIEMDLGDFDGMEARVWASKYPDFLKAWQENPAWVKMPGGESLREVQDRVMETLERITRLYPPGSTLMICAHNFVNITILCCAQGIPLNRFRDSRQETGSLNILYKQGERLWAEVVNDRSHLKKYKNRETS